MIVMVCTRTTMFGGDEFCNVCHITAHTLWLYQIKGERLSVTESNILNEHPDLNFESIQFMFWSV